MAAGIIAELSRKDRSYYDQEDVRRLLGVSRSQAYKIIKEMREQSIKEGILFDGYPSGKIPKKIFNEQCMIA